MLLGSWQTAIPVLAQRTRMRINGNKLLIEDDDYKIEVKEHPNELALLIRSFNGRRNLGDLCGQFHFDGSKLMNLLQSLLECDLLIDLSWPDNVQSAENVVQQLKRECGFWVREIYSSRFWKQVESGHASPQLIVGWGVEFFHFVTSVNEYMALGVSNCFHDERVHSVLIEHYLEECNHDQIFLEGILQCGFDENLVRDSAPLPSTRALINLLCEEAFRSTYRYASVFVAMQPFSQRPSADEIRKYYESLARQYPYARTLFQAFQKHALVDSDLGHNQTVLEKMLPWEHEGIYANRYQIVEAARLAVEAFSLFFAGVFDYYDNSQVRIPRPQFGYLNVITMQER